MHKGSILKKMSGKCAAFGLLIAPLLAGCDDIKTVNINSDVPGAHLEFTKVTPAASVPFTPVPAASETPSKVTLNFTDKPTDDRFQVVAHHVLCKPSGPLDISFTDGLSDYMIRLEQFKQYVTASSYAPTKNNDIWQLKIVQTRTVATTKLGEPQSDYITPPEKITANTNPDVDFPGFAVSPSKDEMVYEQLQKNPGDVYHSSLYKLPLNTNENPTLLTVGDKHQRFPTFDDSGDKIWVSSNDGTRTDAPLDFDSAGNEAAVDTPERMDPTTLEYAFCPVKDTLAFAAVPSGGTGPVIEVSKIDGTGATMRASGMSPQICPADPSKILFVSRPETGGNLRLWTVPTTGTPVVRKLGFIEDADCTDPRWSPGGKLIAFASCKRTLNGDDIPGDRDAEPLHDYWDSDDQHSFIWLMSADGKTSIRITRNESFDSHPVWDRNGRTIYFRSNRGGAWNIWKLTLTDKVLTDLGLQKADIDQSKW